MNRLRLLALVTVGLSVLIISCAKLSPQAPQAEEVMDAPLNGLSYAQNKLFLEGAAEFDETYTEATGLGPMYVSNSCASCHGGDSRGHLFTMLTRFGQADSTGNTFLNQGGPQLQNHAVPGFHAEQVPAGATHAGFIAPIVAGVGFIDALSDAAILANADPQDADGDGISGVPNWIKLPSYLHPASNAYSLNGKYIGRFGRKASTYNLHQQTVNAFVQDMGITSSFEQNNPINYLDYLSAIPTNNPEVDNKSFNALVFYLQALQTPLQRNAQDATVLAGRKAFYAMGCEKCHKETFVSDYSPITVLSKQTFHPYSDFLLHDMGAALDDHYTEGSATSAEWKTTPLWGLGLARNAQGGQYYLLHDGRATSIEAAIALHGGEASASAVAFKQATAADRAALLKFLESL